MSIRTQESTKLTFHPVCRISAWTSEVSKEACQSACVGPATLA
jgi:hypothetical protein